MEDAIAVEDGPIARFEAALEDSFVGFDTVRRWKAETGGRALGFFPVYFPEELAHALGFLPIRLFGAAGRVRLDSATSHTQSFICNIARSVFQLASEGALDVFDVLMFSNICDVARNLSGILKRNFASKNIDYLHYPVNGTSAHAAKYLAEEYRRLGSLLSAVSAVGFDREELRRSIVLYNEKRDLLRKLVVLKERKPWLIPYSEFYAAMRAGGAMPVEEYTEVLARYLRMIEERQEKTMDKIRVVVLGNFCEQAPLPLMRTIEDAGCYVVRDEALLGSWWVGQVDPDGGDPLLSFAQAYTANSTALTVRFHPRIDKQAYLLSMLKGVGVEGVIFCTPKFCEPALYDYMIYKSALDKAKIPYMHAEYEESSSSFETVRTMVETFAESILFD